MAAGQRRREQSQRGEGRGKDVFPADCSWGPQDAARGRAQSLPSWVSTAASVPQHRERSCFYSTGSKMEGLRNCHLRLSEATKYIFYHIVSHSTRDLIPMTAVSKAIIRK